MGVFVPGRGRPKGSLNRATQEAREFATQILESVEYKLSLQLRIQAGELPPQIETLLYYYRYGKPKERVEMEVKSPISGEDLATLTLEELAERNRLLQEELAQELEAERMAAEALAQKQAADRENALIEGAAPPRVM